jgi:hypothetical protein
VTTQAESSAHKRRQSAMSKSGQNRWWLSATSALVVWLRPSEPVLENAPPPLSRMSLLRSAARKQALARSGP